MTYTSSNSTSSQQPIQMQTRRLALEIKTITSMMTLLPTINSYKLSIRLIQTSNNFNVIVD